MYRTDTGSGNNLPGAKEACGAVSRDRAAGSPNSPGVTRRIVGFHRDDEGHWVADLECGHTQHVRHEPPLADRPWVLSEEGRARFLGSTLRCRRCTEEGSCRS
ncbi:MAG TPA: DUF3565 domain-containing protein [Gemmatimonadaceae bacterium]|nr:DUF3565 domain-containing protein [Gemmatimonadaceae bacterium]